MGNGARSLAGVLVNAEHQTLAGQTHMVKPKALAPALTAFFGSEAKLVSLPARGVQAVSV